MQTLQGKPARMEWLDCAKGIAIALVIIGHTVTGAGDRYRELVRAIIFSVHMPLFFMASGATMRFSGSGRMLAGQARKSFRRLIVPALHLFCARTVIEFASGRYGAGGLAGFLGERFQTLIYASGVRVRTGSGVIPEFGMMWFLVVLFISRILSGVLYCTVQDRTRRIAVLAFLSCLGVYFGRTQWLPLSFDVVLTVLPLIWLGHSLKPERLDLRLAGVCFAAWAISFSLVYLKAKGYSGYLELAARRYPFFPRCMIPAVSGSLFVFGFCKAMERFRRFSGLWSYLGRHSLGLFSVHAMDYLYGSLWSRPESTIIRCALRLCLDAGILVLFLAVKTAVLRSKHNAKREKVKNGYLLTNTG